MALDEPRDTDEIIKDNGVTYLIEKGLLEEAKPINVDYIESGMGTGFSITSEKKFGAASSCGSSCAC